MLFTKIPPIYAIIDEYAAWKYDRHPLIAGGQKSLLYRFARNSNLDRVEDIEERHIAFFVGEELTAFYGSQALKAIRGFLWYCHHAGYGVLSYKMATEEHLRKRGGQVQWDMVRKVKELRESRGLSYREMSSELSKVLNKKIHHTSVARWHKRVAELP